MDDWYFARWATGSSNSIWKDLESCYAQVYHSAHPPKRLAEAVDKVLEMFDMLRFKSTFFVTGYVADHFKDLVKRVSDMGHEVACHNYYHIDYKNETREKFRKDLAESKKLLEDLSGRKVIGYRSPNSSIPASLVEDLLEFGFQYDSSVTPSSFMSYKSGDNSMAPRKPYRTDKKFINRAGDSALFEFPWAVFPILKMPAGSGILHRVAGDFYNQLATESSLKLGHTSYYFHPYEITDLKEISHFRLPFGAKIFLRKTGPSYFDSLQRFVKRYRAQLINGKNLLELINTNTVSEH